ncbi:hypothetical protein VQ056_26930 [Paenibacillus sp. JTLBN-2024]
MILISAFRRAQQRYFTCFKQRPLLGAYRKTAIRLRGVSHERGKRRAASALFGAPATYN